METKTTLRYHFFSSLAGKKSKMFDQTLCKPKGEQP